LIAQDLQKIIPEVVHDYDYVTDEKTGLQTKVPAKRLGVQMLQLYLGNPIGSKLSDFVLRKDKTIEENVENNLGLFFQILFILTTLKRLKRC
jgi:hypothetical protein